MLIQRGSPPRPLIRRDAEPTARPALMHVHQDDASTPGDGGHLVVADEGVVFGCAVLEGTAGAPEAHDFGGARERDEHYHYAGVVGLVAGGGQEGEGVREGACGHTGGRGFLRRNR